MLALFKHIRAFPAAFLSLSFCAAHADAAIEMLVSAWGSNNIQSFDPATGASNGVWATAAGLGRPEGIAVSSTGNVYVPSRANGRMYRFSPTGTPMGSFVGSPAPSGMAFGTGGSLFATNFTTNRVLRFDAETGASMGEFITTGLSGPSGIAFGPENVVYVSNQTSGAIQKYDATSGGFLGTLITGLAQPAGIALGSGGRLYAALESSNTVVAIDTATGVNLGPAISGGPLQGAHSVALFEGNLYVVSIGNGKVLRYSAADGAYLGPAAEGVATPTWITFIPTPPVLAPLLLALSPRRRR